MYVYTYKIMTFVTAFDDLWSHVLYRSAKRIRSLVLCKKRNYKYFQVRFFIELIIYLRSHCKRIYPDAPL